MNPKLTSVFLTTWVILAASLAAGRAQSATYANSVASLSPAGYWPMHETAPGAPGDIETNYGSLGPLANGYYSDYQVNVGAFVRQMPGALANDPDPAVFFRGPSNGGTATNGLTVPHTSPLATLKPPFSVECWMMATNEGTGQGDIISQANGFKSAGFRVYYQNNTTGCVVALVYNGTASGTLTFTASSATNQWHHLVLTCAANTNMAVYFDGVQGGVLGSANAIAETGKFLPDLNTPFVVGTGLGYQRAFSGLVDEVAVYTNVITDIGQHYYDGISGGAGAYDTDVLNDNPVIYLRMNSSTYAPPAVAAWPVLSNYGQTNGVVIGGGVYTPGTMPGLADGTAYAHFPLGLASGTVALLSGVSSFADAGNAAAYNPVGPTPFAVAAIFRGNPTDTNRVQSIVGHGTNSWELGLTALGRIVFNSGTNSTAVVATGTAAGDLVSSSFVNDGGWHEVVAVHSGTTNTLYLDGVASATNLLAAANNTGNGLDVLIGSDPSYTNTPVGLGRQFAGEICEVVFFTNALSSAQVQTLYNDSGVLPVITQQPASAAVNAGTAFTNQAVLSGGSGPLAYQWYANGTALGAATNLMGGATNSSLIISPVLPGDAATNYYLVVTNVGGAVTSSVVSLTVYAAPAIVSALPVTYTNLFTLYAGASPTFSIVALGPQLAYQWYSNGVALAAGTNSSLTLPGVRTAFTTVCVLANSYGSATSSVWTAQILSTNALAPYPQAVLALSPAAYWRLADTNLDEIDNGSGDDGYICHDYSGGNDGIYTNVLLGQPGYSSTDPLATSALFGWYTVNNSDANSMLAPDFSAPSGSNAEFTVEAWVYPPYTQTGNAGIVTKGYFNQEEFNLDVGAPTNSFRFEVRNAAGTDFSLNSQVSTANPNLLNQWFHLVGVCDEANGLVSFYINGVLVTNKSIPVASGLYNSSKTPISIGGRSSSATSGVNNQFVGNINDVAVFNYALSSNQVAAEFGASGVAPAFVLAPPDATLAGYGSTLIIPTLETGTSPLSYRWFDVNANSYIAGQTNATLVLSNLTASDSYYLTVTNAYGSTNSAAEVVSVISGLPQVYTDVQNPFYGIEGGVAANSAGVYGTMPLAYRWQFSNGAAWVNLADGARISGSGTLNLTISNVFGSDAGSYQLVVTNSFGAVTSSVAQLMVAGWPLNFYTNGLFWTPNGSGRIANDVLSLTDPANGGGQGSFFFQTPQYIGAFSAAFTYQAGGNKAADGVSFCLQDDPRGAAAIGGGGGQLAVGGSAGQVITPSVELMMDIFNGNGYAVGTNGANYPNAGAASANFAAPGTVQFNSGDPIDVTVDYANGEMALSLTDAVAGRSFATNLYVGDITKVLRSNVAYVGFTGSYGGSTSVQTITDFTFVSVATQAIQLNGHSALISWPGPVSGYVLQQNADLTTTNWSNVTNADNVVGGQHQVVVPLGGTNIFYRLLLR